METRVGRTAPEESMSHPNPCIAMFLDVSRRPPDPPKAPDPLSETGVGPQRGSAQYVPGL